ncbi:SDR family NAD(P)-dependent oxidoreductase [Selenomonas sp. AE3005]|uniref:SDR family NAD(P)-dependent oxidoreductase n=1 Tax=Selenomonas sp. AE3005 TaxID=1485543 RepID=UPI0005674265|nr:SDR family oxidoreductase [Selenomonas sp. AE3005]
MVDLQRKKILVTGASSGIGRAVALQISKMGASVVACGRDYDRLMETNRAMAGTAHKIISFDVKDFSKYDLVFNDAVADGRKLDGLVHCAGVAIPTPLRIMSEDVVHNILDVNYVSFMMLVQRYIKRKYSNGGSIVAISSINSHYPQKCMSVYAASKFAIEASVKTMSLEMAEKGIRINCVVPGAVNTPMTQCCFEKTQQYLEKKSLLGMSEPEDVANMIVFLLSTASRKITGRAMFIDSGWLGQ